jgi:nucleotide-binding universal stress UspA family protein
MDGSPFGDAAANLAMTWADRRKAALVGLGVLDAPSITRPELVPPGGMSFKRQKDAARLADAHVRIQSMLKAFGARCQRARIPYALVEDVGVSHEQIILEAERCDLVVFGRETHFQFETQDAPDETLSQVLRRSPRPVVVVPREPAQGSGCLIAYGGGREVARTLETFTLLGMAEGEAVDVITFHAERSEAKRRLERAGEYLGAHGITARLHPLSTDKAPAAAILAEVQRRRPRLLVMGSHGHHPLRDLFFTSVTRAVLKDTPVPVFAGA